MRPSLYTRGFTSRHPGLFIFLLDQSASMGEPVKGQKYSKADLATTALNNLIFEMVRGGPPARKGQRQNYAYLAVLGYNDKVFPLLSPDLADIVALGDHPAGTASVSRNVYDTHIGAYRQVIEPQPYWIKPDARGKTQMAEALSMARDIALRWLHQTPEASQAARQECFPPVVINITDAQDNGRGDPLAVAEELRRASTQQGDTLIFTCYFTKHTGQPLIFPGTREQVAHLDPPYAEQMFLMSSVIPEALRKKAAFSFELDHELAAQARGFIYNVDPQALVRFLLWGTQNATITIA